MNIAQTDEARVTPAAPSAERVVRITAHRSLFDLGLKDLIKAYELVWVFTLRQLSVQYKQAVLGIGWALMNPLISTGVFTLIFGRVMKVPSDGLPYPLFVLSGLVMWQFFSRAVTSGSNSLVGNSHILSKVYFPRAALPLSGVLAGLVDILVNLVILFALMAVYGYVPGLQLLTLPLFVGMTVLFAFALSLWLSALNALYRDIGFAIPIVLQVWLFLTPVIYPVTLMPASLSWLLELNPMSALIQGARWAVLPGALPPTGLALGIAGAETFLVLLGGIVLFNKIDAVLTDRI